MKWSLATACAAYLGYANAKKIDQVVLEVKYATVEAEKAFVAKDQALDLRLSYQRNSAGNLETYLVSFNQKLPIYLREQGLVLGDSAYLLENLTKHEQARLCKGKDREEESKEMSTKVPGTFQRLFEILTSKE